ncbi:30S ribosomal protein S18 [Chloroflexota bacterium]
MAKRKPNQTKSRKWGRGRYVPRRKFCAFCANKIEVIDYKEPVKLRQYISDGGKIEPRHKTGTCAKHQRALAVSIKRARHLALLPYVPAHARKMRSVSTIE